MGGVHAGFKCATLKGPFAISCVSKLFEVIDRCVCALVLGALTSLWRSCISSGRARHKSGALRDPPVSRS